jgi:hypothetical protein
MLTLTANFPSVEVRSNPSPVEARSLQRLKRTGSPLWSPISFSRH